MGKISFPHYKDHKYSLALFDFSTMRIDVNYKIDGSALVVAFPEHYGAQPKFLRRLGEKEIVLALGDPFSSHYARVVNTVRSRLEKHPTNLSRYYGWTAFLEFCPGSSNDEILIFLSFMTNNNGYVIIPSDPHCSIVASIIGAYAPPLVYSGPVSRGSEWNKVLRSNSITRDQLNGLMEPERLKVIEGIKTPFEGLAVFAQDIDRVTFTWKVVDAEFTDFAKRRRSYSYALASAVGRCISESPLFSKYTTAELCGKFVLEGLRDIGPAPYDQLILALVSWMAGEEIIDEVGSLSEVLNHVEGDGFVKRLSFLDEDLEDSHVWRLVYRMMFFAVSNAYSPNQHKYYSTEFREFLKAVWNVFDDRRIKFDKIVKDLPWPVETEASMIIGRFQPFHNGHLNMVRTAKNENVILVRPKSAGPIGSGYLCDVSVEGKNIIVYEMGTGDHVGTMIAKCRNAGLEVTEVICGNDRYRDYVRLISPANRVRGLPNTLSVDVRVADRITSGTLIRSHIAEGRQAAFEMLTPPSIHHHYAEFKAAIEAEVSSD